jgi:hypothetical protein
MRFSVGYQPDAAWIDAIVARADRLDEVYFAYGAMPSGRGAVANVDRQLEDLGRIADAGIGLNILFNANCYGARDHARARRGAAVRLRRGGRPLRPRRGVLKRKFKKPFRTRPEWKFKLSDFAAPAAAAPTRNEPAPLDCAR